MKERPVILIAEEMIARLVDLLAPDYEALPFWTAEGRSRAGEARAIVTASFLPIDAALLATMPRLGLIAVFGAGYDNVDVAAAQARGIAISNGGAANAEDVADHAIALLLAQRRRIVEGDHRVRSGTWTAETRLFSRSLGGARLGIVGMGHIGQAVARRAEPMRMQVAWWGPRAKPDLPWPRLDSLEALARASDILVVASRADESNRGLISAAILDALGPQGLLVNVARGTVVDEDALIAALRAGRLGGAALDVFETEPTPPERWADVPHCVLATHSGGATDAAMAGMTALLQDNLAAFFAGRSLRTSVSG